MAILRANGRMAALGVFILVTLVLLPGYRGSGRVEPKPPTQAQATSDRADDTGTGR